MRQWYWAIVLMSASGLMLAATGCLSLGGRTTTYTGESPATAARLSTLEARVASLEQSVYGRVPPTAEQIVEPAPTQVP